jgi:DNA polymerase eta
MISRMAAPSSSGSVGRVVAHIDMDCFYVQVERKLDPVTLSGVASAVAQYNPFGSLVDTAWDQPRLNLDNHGALIAVSYEARALGVKRNMSRKEARTACPRLQIVQVRITYQTS